MKANKEAAPKKNAAIPNGVAENNAAKKTNNTKCNLQQSYDIYKFNSFFCQLFNLLYWS